MFDALTGVESVERVKCVGIGDLVVEAGSIAIVCVQAYGGRPPIFRRGWAITVSLVRLKFALNEV